jgi:hypothetical protein
MLANNIITWLNDLRRGFDWYSNLLDTPICLSIYLSIYGSTALVYLHCFFSFLIYTQLVALLGRGMSPSQGRYLHTTQTQNKRTQTSMPLVGFEATNSVLERAKTVHALDRSATVIGFIAHLRNITENNYECLIELDTPKITVTTAHIKSSVFISRCWVAAFICWRFPSSGFPNCPRPQLAASHFLQLQLSLHTRYLALSLHVTVYKYSLPTSRETHRVSITETSRLMSCAETFEVYSEDHAKRINRLRGKSQSFLMLKQVARALLTPLECYLLLERATFKLITILLHWWRSCLLLWTRADTSAATACKFQDEMNGLCKYFNTCLKVLYSQILETALPVLLPAADFDVLRRTSVLSQHLC